MLRRTHSVAQRIAAFWKSLGGELEHPVDTNMVCVGISVVGKIVDHVALSRDHSLVNLASPN